MNWSDYGQFVEEMSYGLMALGLKSKEFGAVLAPTSHLWSACDLSIIFCGGVSVPIYPTSSSADIEHILNNSDAKIVFVHNEPLLKKLLAIKENVPLVEKIILMTPPAKGRSLSEIGVDRQLVIGIEELQELGRALKLKEPQLVTERQAAIDRQDLATVIYTSGTTGTPKGVMLSHDNILSVIADMPDIIPVRENDTYLSFLPLSHVFERICGEFYWVFNGATCAYAEGIEHVGKNMGEAQPTTMLVVPRILDKIYSKVRAGIDGASGRSRKLIEWSLSVGKEVNSHRNAGKPLRRMLEAKYWLAEKLVLKKLRERICPSLRLVVSGGAPATAEVIEFFNAVGITVVEGYGLTETSAPTNVNRIQVNKYGTVGPSLPSVTMRIADDGEVLFKGPTIFKGYYKSDELTNEVFNDGWFHTGDIGVVDKDGYLKITDRKKDIIVNSAGKNIAPQKIEGILRTIPYVNQAIVFGDKKKTLVALFTLEEQPIIEFAREQGWQFNEYAEILQLKEFRKYMQQQIDEACRNLADYEKVRNFSVLAQELSVEQGELTATLKVKRAVLKTKYKDLVDSLYSPEGSLATSGRQLV